MGKSSTKKGKPAPSKRFNVEFQGRAYVRGILTVTAENEQAARATAFAEYQEEGIEWRFNEEDENYDVRIVEVDPL